MSFIKLDRNIIDSYCFANPNHLKIWLWLLVKANFKKNYVPLQIGKGTTTILVDRGQLIFGRFVAEKELKMNGSMIYRILKKFEELGQINIEANNQYSVITICKYDSYQSNNLESEQQTNNQCTTNEQQMNSSCIADEQSLNILKEGLESKESKEGIEDTLSEKNHLKDYLINSNLYRQPNIPTFEEVHQDFKRKGGTEEMAKKFYEANSGVGWYRKGTPITNFRYFVSSFIENFKTYQNVNNSKPSSKTSKGSTRSEAFEFYRNYASQFSDGSDEKQTD